MMAANICESTLLCCSLDGLSATGLLLDFEAGYLLISLATQEQGCWPPAIGTTKQIYPKHFVGTCQDP